MRRAFPLSGVGPGVGFPVTKGEEAVALAGHTILIVEDEPLIALAIVEDFTAAGASVHTAYNLCDRLRLADHPDLSAAVVDFGLSDGKGSALCERLNERQVPFVLHTGYTHVHEACQSGIVVPKPAAAGQLVSAIERLLQGGSDAPKCSGSRQ
jgi:DNA-binding response OmpR family regulator